MHMADALLSPTVGGAFWAVSALAVSRSSWKIRRELEAFRIPLMGVLGAFVFAAQMINFAIPGTGSSGHLGGGLLLAMLLGPDAALLAIASVLAVQALVFADGGLLAYGCNVFNMGVLPAFVAYPLFARALSRTPGWQRNLAIVLTAVVGLQMGAFAVVLETVLSGRTELPFRAFAMAMQPIHLAIGFVEGLVTATLLGFLHRAKPEVLLEGRENGFHPGRGLRIVGLLALMLAGVLAWFASTRPDGLEWATKRVSGREELNATGTVHAGLAHVQQRAALMPDYRIHGQESRAGTSMAGITGGLITLALLGGAGGLLMMLRRKIRN